MRSLWLGLLSTRTRLRLVVEVGASSAGVEVAPAPAHAHEELTTFEEGGLVMHALTQTLVWNTKVSHHGGQAPAHAHGAQT